jgi:Protein of unknown function (DUF1360).
MDIPNWYELILLALAAWRSFQLISDDDILDRPRRYLLRLGEEWEKDGDPVPDNYRFKLGEFITCPYCAGFWIAVTWWVSWQIWPHATLVVAVPWVLSAGVVAASKVLSRD